MEEQTAEAGSGDRGGERGRGNGGEWGGGGGGAIGKRVLRPDPVFEKLNARDVGCWFQGENAWVRSAGY